MDILIKVAQLILCLSILILIHEFGHYIAARIFKTRVEKFFLFFNPGFSLFKFKMGETEYGLGWLPLGGYVKISGMIDESMDKDQLKLPPQPWEFRSKPAWQRLIIMLGGIIMNVVLGITVYWMLLFFNGEEYLPTANMKYGVAVDSLGWEMGFQNGDKILAVNGRYVDNFSKIPSTIIIDMAKTVTVERNGQQVNVPVSQSMIKKAIDSKDLNFISERYPFEIAAFSPGSAAKEAGMKEHDKVIAINDHPVYYFDEVKNQLNANRGKNIKVTYARGNDTLSSTVAISSDGMLGVQVAPITDFIKTKTSKYSIFSSLPAGIRKAYEILSNYVKQFALIFSPKVQGYKHVGGFISIANTFAPTWDWISFWTFTGFLSIALAFMNLLPIPALDGGHVLFTLYEMITRRKPSEKFLEYAQITGMLILLSLMVYANGNDILGLFR